MPTTGVIIKRCGCRDANRRRLESSCPRLTERGHGTWYFHCSVTNLVGRRERVRRGGYRSRAAARRARDEWLAGTEADRTAQGWTVRRWLWHWLDSRTRIRPTTQVRAPQPSCLCAARSIGRSRWGPQIRLHPLYVRVSTPTSEHPRSTPEIIGSAESWGCDGLSAPSCRVGGRMCPRTAPRPPRSGLDACTANCYLCFRESPALSGGPCTWTMEDAPVERSEESRADSLYGARSCRPRGMAVRDRFAGRGRARRRGHRGGGDHVEPGRGLPPALRDNQVNVPRLG